MMSIASFAPSVSLSDEIVVIQEFPSASFPTMTRGTIKVVRDEESKGMDPSAIGPTRRSVSFR